MCSVVELYDCRMAETGDGDGAGKNVVALPKRRGRPPKVRESAPVVDAPVVDASPTHKPAVPDGVAADVIYAPPSANLSGFRAFCASLKVDTKDHGVMYLSPENWLGTQRYFIEQVEKGLREGVHSFVVLKGRQLGLTTISLALDLFFLFKYGGLSGSLVTHDEESRDMFKSTLQMYIDGLPVKYRVPIDSHNRTQLVAKNRSRVAYQVAGTRKNSKLGKGKGLTFLHATEVSAWGDEEGLASLIASLSDIHPNRLYIYESTAQGFNMFKDMWDRAQDSTSERGIFVGWWRKESYSMPENSNQFRVYWGETKDAGRMDAEERSWVKEVWDEHQFEITPEQIAWWRWYKAEKIEDESLMYQNFPPTARQAFISSGSNFFSSARLSDEMRRIRSLPKGQMYKFVLRENFEDCDLTECTAKQVNLTVWEAPERNALYAIGADPAYGSSDWADRFCASVWRCYGDGMVQVAEFNTADCNTYQFAWVIMYLAGAYTMPSETLSKSSVMLNLEINGPGQAVWQEIQNLRRMAGASPKSKVSQKIMMVAKNLQNYLYKRLDTFGKPSAYHWQTTGATKERMLNFYKDCFERGVSTLNSTGLISEMQDVIRDEGEISAFNRRKDDRVIAAGLAHVAWSDYLRMQAIQRGMLKPTSDGGVDLAKGRVAQPGVSYQMKGYLNRLGVKVG